MNQTLGKKINLENSKGDLLFDKKAGNILLLCYYHFFLSCRRNRKWIRFEFPLLRFCFVKIRWKFLLTARKFGKILGAQQGNLSKGIDNCSGCGLICGTSSLEDPGQQFFFISTQKHKRGYQKKVPMVKKKSQNCKRTCQIVLFSLKTAISNHFVSLQTVFTVKVRRRKNICTNWNSLSYNGFVVNTL